MMHLCFFPSLSSFSQCVGITVRILCGATTSQQSSLVNFPFPDLGQEGRLLLIGPGQSTFAQLGRLGSIHSTTSKGSPFIPVITHDNWNVYKLQFLTGGSKVSGGRYCKGSPDQGYVSISMLGGGINPIPATQSGPPPP